MLFASASLPHVAARADEAASAITAPKAAPDLDPVMQPAPATTSAPSSAPCLASRYVVLGATKDSLTEELMGEVAKDLAVELASRGMAVCAAESAEHRPAAIVTLSRLGPRHASIAVEDLATNKRLARDLTLTTLPDNGRALALALAIDELLRASWAELILPPARSPTETDTPFHPLANPDELAPRTESTPWHRAPGTLALTAGAWFMHGATAWNAAGARVVASVVPAPGARLGLGVRVYRSLEVANALGSVHGVGAGLELSGGACGSSSVALCLDLRLAADRLSFAGDAASNARAHHALGTPITAELVASATWPARGPWFVGTELSGGFALRGVNAGAAGSALSGLRGALVGCGLSLGGRR